MTVHRSLCCSVVIVGLFFGSTAAAQQADSRLEQTIEPIECVDTRTEDGFGGSLSTACSDKVAPTLGQITISSNRQPVLQGAVAGTEMKRLRVWVGGLWYTYGVSPYLTVVGNSWSLDLSESPVLLPAGSYTVIVEVLTTDSFLMRSVYEYALSIPSPSATGVSDDNTATRFNTKSMYRFEPRGDNIYMFAPNPAAIDQVPLSYRHTEGLMPVYDSAHLTADEQKNINIWVPTVIVATVVAAGALWRFAIHRSKNGVLLRKQKKSN